MFYKALQTGILALALTASAHAADAIAIFTTPSGHKVQIVEAPFSESKLSYSESVPCLVAGRIPFGTDCGIPLTYVKSLTVKVNGRKIKLDISQMFNAWGERHHLMEKGKFRYFGGSCTSPEFCTFRGLFSDGAGTFVAEWLVVQGVAMRTVITNDEQIVAIFMDNIDAKNEHY